MAYVGCAFVKDHLELRDLLARLSVGEVSYFQLEKPESITDWRQGKPQLDELENYDSGRLFGDQGEVRWQRRRDSISLIWLSENAVPPPFEAFGNWEADRKVRFLLRNTRETRVPRKISYPVTGVTPEIEAINYRNQDTQAVMFTRFCRFIGGE